MTKLQTTIGRRGARAVRHALAIGGLVAMLAGCHESSVAENDYPNDYRLRHPITLKEGNRTVEVFVSRNRGGLAPAQRADVLAFAQLWRREATSGVILEVPQGGPTDQAAADSLREIHSILAASGVPGNAVAVRGYRPSETALASIKISYAKMIAEAGPCGQWPDNLGPGQDANYLENRPYWNLGCANQRNLAAMIDNPSDLVQPRGEQPSYAARRTVAIDKYRRGDSPSGTYSADYDTGKISNVGK